MKNTSKKGFTLVELVIVIAVIAILAGVLIGTFASVLKRAKDSAEVQNIKNAEIAQKADDIIKKIEDSNWFGWEDFEAKIVEKITTVVKANSSSFDSNALKSVVQDVVTTALANIEISNTDLTADQVEAIVANALGTLKYEGVTEAQVRAIVNAATNTLVGTQLSAAQVRSIITIANENKLTAAQVAEIVGRADFSTTTDVQTALTTITTALTTTTSGLATSAQAEEIKVLIEQATANLTSGELHDVILAKGLNIKLDKSNKVIETPSDVVAALDQPNPVYGVSTDNLILLDLTNKTFIVVRNSTGYPVVYATNLIAGDDLNNEYKYWTFKKETSTSATYSKFSVYLLDDSSVETVTLNGVGLDVGNNAVVTTMNYNGVGTARTVVIRTNGGTLTINAPYDTVNHYGEGVVLNIAAIAGSSYHEYGYFPKALIAQGRMVVEESGEIPSVEITAVPTVENPIKIETGKDIVVSASEDVVTALGENKLDNVQVKVTDTKATVVVDEKVDTSKVEGKSTTDLITITKVRNLAELKAALLDTDAKYIQVIQDISSVNELIKINRSVILDGDGHTISGNGGSRGSNKRLIVVNYDGSSNVAPTTGTSDVEIRNANLIIGSETAGVAYAGVIETRGFVNSLTLENVNAYAYYNGTGYCQPLTLGGNQYDVTLNVSIKKSHIYGNDHYAIIIWNRVNMTIEDSVLEAWAGLYFKAANSSNGTYGSEVKTVGTRFICPNYHSGASNSFGAIVFEDGGIKLDIENCVFDVTSYGDQAQSAILFSGYWAQQTGGNLVNNQIRMKNVDIKGTINDTTVQYDNSNGIIIDSGRTTVDPSIYVSDDSVVINEGLFYLIKGRD